MEFFNFSAAASILNYLAISRIRGRRPSIRERSCAVRAALEYLEDTETLPLTVSELCSKTGVSAPTIYRAFREQFGVGPKRYIQIRRLNGVRQELLAKNSTASVTDIANYWGFWHMGQFAADYRRHFGELPSETLAHKKD
jgi:AraC-like DNA-binding protein